VPKRATVGDVKGPEQRDDFGNWAWDARQVLDLSAEWVAEAINYSRSQVVKAEGTGPRARRMLRELPALYLRLAKERGVTLPPVPGAKPEPTTASAAPDDLLAVVRQQTAHIEALTGAIERQSHDIAELLALVERLMPRPSTPAALPEYEEHEPGDDGLSRAALAGDRLARYETAREAGDTPPASPRPPSALRTPARRTTP